MTPNHQPRVDVAQPRGEHNQRMRGEERVDLRRQWGVPALEIGTLQDQAADVSGQDRAEGVTCVLIWKAPFDFRPGLCAQPVQLVTALGVANGLDQPVGGQFTEGPPLDAFGPH